MRKFLIAAASFAALAALPGLAAAQSNTTVGVGTGAVAGAVVGGPIGAVVGGVAGGFIGASTERRRSYRYRRASHRRYRHSRRYR